MTHFEKTQTKNPARRSIKTSFTIEGTEQTDAQGRISIAVLEISTSHHTDQKMFFSTVNRMRTHQDGMFTVSSYALMEKAPVASGIKSVARYSVKALEATHEEFLLTVAPQMEVALEWASNK